MLYIVPTPIGNLRDITLRAIDVLESVEIVACEDVLHSLVLLNTYNIKKKTMSYHKFNERENLNKLIGILESGINVALISDAGSPLISDPGNLLITTLVEKNLDFEVLPGATAFVPALTYSGFDLSNFYFFGFLKGRNNERINKLNDIKNLSCPIVFYVAVHSIKEDINTISKILGNRRACLVKDISKLHQNIYRFNLADDIEIMLKGEFVLVVDGADSSSSNLNLLSIEDHIKHYEQMGIDRMSAIKQVAKDRNTKKSDIYNIVNK